MICRRILGKIEDDAPNVDWVEIDWPQTLRRALRLVSNAGTRVDVLLPPGGRLNHGDVLFSADDKVIAVFLRPCDVMALRMDDVATAARVALRLGSLHLSAEVESDTLFTPADGPAEALAADLKVPFSVQKRRFFPDMAL